jgi:hypothetical protein
MGARHIVGGLIDNAEDGLRRKSLLTLWDNCADLEVANRVLCDVNEFLK